LSGIFLNVPWRKLDVGQKYEIGLHSWKVYAKKEEEETKKRKNK
jgi:hypothetical protein